MLLHCVNRRECVIWKNVGSLQGVIDEFPSMVEYNNEQVVLYTNASEPSFLVNNFERGE